MITIVRYGKDQMKFLTVHALIFAATCLPAVEKITTEAAETTGVDYKAICFFAGIFLVLTGLTKGVPAFAEWRRYKKLLLDGIEAKGIINDSWKAASGEYGEISGSHCLSAEFKTVDNRTFQVVAPFVVFSPRKLLNTEISIIYDPDNPGNAQFRDEIHPSRRLLVLIVYILMFVSGLGLFLYLYIVV